MSLTLRPDTLKRYRGDMDRHVKPRLGQKRLTQLTAEDLRELYRFLLEQGRIAPRPGLGPGLSPATVRGIHAALHQALQAAADQGLMPNNPAKHVEPPKVPRNAMNILTEEQLEQFVADNTTGKVLGIFGEETVNVLGVNLDIAEALGLIGGVD